MEKPRAQDQTDRFPQYIATVLEEYKSIREESKQASINMFAALQWGAAVQGVVVVGAFTQWDKEPGVVLFAFCLLVPALCAMTMLLWLGEAARMKRAGDYVGILEQKVSLLLDEFRRESTEFQFEWAQVQARIEKNLNLSFTEVDLVDPLAWEQWLKEMAGRNTSEGHLKLLYQLRIAFFPFLMASSLFIGMYYSFCDPGVVAFSFVGIRTTFTKSEQWLVPLLMIIGWAGFLATTRFSVLVGQQLSRKSYPEGRHLIRALQGKTRSE
jgi:hypothetical protein